jgi:hypothetical protein
MKRTKENEVPSAIKTVAGMTFIKHAVSLELWLASIAFFRYTKEKPSCCTVKLRK